MGGLGHILESEGLATVQISLIREHTEIIKPPRALWVPFMLGRPLGQPGDGPFQTQVLRAVLGLLEAEAGPLLEDYPEEATGGIELTDWVCPVSFPRPEDDSLAEALRREVQQHHSWYDIGLRKTGRTTFGAAGMSVEEVQAFIIDLAEGRAEEDTGAALTLKEKVRLAGEDLKAFYGEAMLAQPGEASAHDLKDWFWRTTVAAETILAALKQVRQRGDPGLVSTVELLVPKELR